LVAVCSEVANPDGAPAIEVEVGSRRWQAIIDTGFKGELENDRSHTTTATLPIWSR
jgi:hypothetical protein